MRVSVPGPISSKVGLRGRGPRTGFTSCQVAMPISSRAGLWILEVARELGAPALEVRLVAYPSPRPSPSRGEGEEGPRLAPPLAARLVACPSPRPSPREERGEGEEPPNLPRLFCAASLSRRAGRLAASPNCFLPVY